MFWVGGTDRGVSVCVFVHTCIQTHNTGNSQTHQPRGASKSNTGLAQNSRNPDREKPGQNWTQQTSGIQQNTFLYLNTLKKIPLTFRNSLLDLLHCVKRTNNPRMKHLRQQHRSRSRTNCKFSSAILVVKPRRFVEAAPFTRIHPGEAPSHLTTPGQKVRECLWQQYPTFQTTC